MRLYVDAIRSNTYSTISNQICNIKKSVNF